MEKVVTHTRAICSSIPPSSKLQSSFIDSSIYQPPAPIWCQMRHSRIQPSNPITSNHSSINHFFPFLNLVLHHRSLPQSKPFIPPSTIHSSSIPSFIPPLTSILVVAVLFSAEFGKKKKIHLFTQCERLCNNNNKKKECQTLR